MYLCEEGGGGMARCGGEGGTRGCVETRDWRTRRGKEGDGSGGELCVDSIRV